MVYPSLILAYMGQAAYLSRHHEVEHAYHFGFYVSVPGRPCVYHSFSGTIYIDSERVLG